MSIEAMKQALEALDWFDKNATTIYEIQLAHAAALHLRTAIEQAEKQEPVAWYDREDDCAYVAAELGGADMTGLEPLYTTPPAAQRQWVGLDAADWFKWWRTATVLGHTQADIDFADFLMIAVAVQDVLGKKNGGKA